MPRLLPPCFASVADQTDITAPFGGVLNAVGIEVGDVVTDGFGENDAIGQIYDLDPIVIVAAVVTPTGDPYTLLLLSGPLYLLYEITIWLIRWTLRK